MIDFNMLYGKLEDLGFEVARDRLGVRDYSIDAEMVGQERAVPDREDIRARESSTIMQAASNNKIMLGLGLVALTGVVWLGVRAVK